MFDLRGIVGSWRAPRNLSTPWMLFGKFSGPSKLATAGAAIGRAIMAQLAQPAPAARMAHAFRREGPIRISFPADAAAGAAYAMEREMPKPPTATLVANLRKQAKQAAREGRATHSEELDRLAIAEGYPSWRALQAAAEPFDLPVDPDLREDFDSTPNEDRPQSELDRWWDRPYAKTLPDGRLIVRCLDGGAWDRSTNYGVAATLAEARELAQRKLAEWRRISSQPTAYMLGDGLVQFVVMARRLDEDFKALSDPMPSSETSAWMEKWRREHPEAD